MLLLLLSAGNFAIGMGAFVVIGLLNPLAEAFDLSPAEAGWVMTSYAIAYALGSPVAVAATGNLPRRTVLLSGLALFMIGALATAAAPTAELLFAARVVVALGAGMFTPIAAGIAIATSAPEVQGAALAKVFAGLTIAQAVGVPAGAWIGYTLGWQAAFVLTALLCAACWAGLWRGVPADLPNQATRLSDLGAMLTRGWSVLTILFTASFLGAIYVVYTYLAPLLSDRMGYGRDGITVILVLFGLGAVLGNLLGGWMTDRIGPFRTLLILSLSQVAIMPIFVFLPMPDVALAILVLVWSVMGWSFTAAQQIRVVQAEPEKRSVALALNAASIYVGASLGAALGGWVLEAAGPGWVGPAGGAFAALAVLHLLMTERHLSGRT
ncbi:MAG: MFS transporter [Pseudomonadota bacterium]